MIRLRSLDQQPYAQNASVHMHSESWPSAALLVACRPFCISHRVALGCPGW